MSAMAPDDAIGLLREERHDGPTATPCIADIAEVRYIHD